jgi:hypothetical protein
MWEDQRHLSSWGQNFLPLHSPRLLNQFALFHCASAQNQLMPISGSGEAGQVQLPLLRPDPAQHRLPRIRVRALLRLQAEAGIDFEKQFPAGN